MVYIIPLYTGTVHFFANLRWEMCIEGKIPIGQHMQQQQHDVIVS